MLIDTKHLQQSLSSTQRSILEARPSPSRRGAERPRRRSHELRADRIGDRVPQDGLDPCFDIWTQIPANDVIDGLNLVGAPAAPKRNSDALIENPAVAR
jgi:hypothetical protein